MVVHHPTACMKADTIVEPTNLNPRRLRSLDSASEIALCAGIAAPRGRRLRSGLPPTNPQA